MQAFKSQLVPENEKDKLELEASFYWDEFYRYNSNRFFKDRHWLVSEFPGLLDAKEILEAGCGAGNTAFPLLDSLPLAHIYACDFASNAVSLVQKHPLYKEGRVTAFAADLTQDNLSHWIKPHSVDACMMIFVLSAISPEAMVTALRNVAQILKPGVGQVFFRDYAAGDLAEMRFSAVKGRQQHLGGRFFARSDGTRAFYFEERVVRALFEQSGFECVYLGTRERNQMNRTRGITMKRRFCQGIFTVSANNNNQRNWYPFAPVAKDRKPIIRETLPLDPTICEMEVINFECGFLNLKLNIPLTLHAKYSNTLVTEGRLARLVWFELSNILLNRRLLLVGCGPYALAAFASLRWSRRVLALDYEEDTISTLRRNAIANGSKFVFERLRVQLVSKREQIGQLILTGLEGSPDVILLTISGIDSMKGLLDNVLEVLEKHSSALAIVAVLGMMQDRFEGSIALVGQFECELLHGSKNSYSGRNEVNVYSLKVTNRS